MSGVPNQRTVEIDNLITSTWYDVRKSITDEIYKITPYLDKLVQGGRIRSRVPDGTHFEIPVRYAKADGNIENFGRGHLFALAEQQVNTRLIYQTKNVGDSIVRYWDDERKNRGKAKILDYVDDIVQNHKLALQDKFEHMLFNDQSATDPLAFHGLSVLVSTTPTTGTLGGLNRANNSWMTNQTKDFTGLTTSANLLDEMRSMYAKCSEYKSMSPRRSPDLIICHRNVYNDYERIAQAMQQIVTNTSSRASLGFGELMFKNAEIFWAPECPSGTMYFLNTGSIEFPYDPAYYFDMTEWKWVAGNSLDRTAQIVTVCNHIATTFQNQGVIYNITTVSA